MLTARSAVILNFTANTYHWGCYGTSMEVYQSLLERGYYPTWASVHATHGFAPSPSTLDQMRDPGFVRSAVDANRALAAALAESDVVVVNGEGTLHRTHPAPRNLLFLIHLARHHFGKPVHLINHSFFPSGTRDGSPDADALYRGGVEGLACVVPREAWSLGILQRLGIPAVQGFDCLPRFIARHQAELAPNSAFRGALLLSGGVSLTEAWARRISRVVASTLRAGQRVVYLSGAKRQPAREDRILFEWMREGIADLEFYDATSMANWLNAIAGAQGLVSARFHHTLAAAMLGTPVIVCPSNTPKLEAVCDMLRLEAPLAFDDRLDERLAESLAALQAGRGSLIGDTTRRAMLELAAANFASL